MTALAANRNPDLRGVTSITLGAKTNVHVYAGGFVFNDAGWARGGVPTVNTPVLGISRDEVDNTGGANGAKNVVAERGDAYPFANGAGGDALAAADIGKNVYAIDDATVGKTDGAGTRPVAGTLVALGADSIPWVQIDRSAGLGVAGIGAGYKIARGQATTVAAVDTIATGLTTVVAVVASLDSDPIDDPEWVTASIGDQAGAPVAGSFLLKTWKNTAGNDPTPVAATTFGKKVNWIAIGI